MKLCMRVKQNRLSYLFILDINMFFWSAGYTFFAFMTDFSWGFRCHCCLVNTKTHLWFIDFPCKGKISSGVLLFFNVWLPLHNNIYCNVKYATPNRKENNRCVTILCYVFIHILWWLIDTIYSYYLKFASVWLPRQLYNGRKKILSTPKTAKTDLTSSGCLM